MTRSSSCAFPIPLLHTHAQPFAGVAPHSLQRAQRDAHFFGCLLVGELKKIFHFEGRAPVGMHEREFADSIKEISKADTEILAAPAVVQTVTSAKPIANGETKNWQGWTIEAIPAYNLKRGPTPGKLFHDKGRGNGYVLTHGGKRFYFSGDTEGIPEMRALKNIDVAFVCMNLPYTMPPEEAADAVKAFHPKIVIPYHYRGSDLAVFQRALEGTGIEVRLLDWYPK